MGEKSGISAVMAACSATPHQEFIWATHLAPENEPDIRSFQSHVNLIMREVRRKAKLVNIFWPWRAGAEFQELWFSCSQEKLGQPAQTLAQELGYTCRFVTPPHLLPRYTPGFWSFLDLQPLDPDLFEPTQRLLLLTICDWKNMIEGSTSIPARPGLKARFENNMAHTEVQFLKRMSLEHPPDLIFSRRDICDVCTMFLGLSFHPQWHAVSLIECTNAKIWLRSSQDPEIRTLIKPPLAEASDRDRPLI